MPALLVRRGTDADADAAASVVERVLAEHRLPFDPGRPASSASRSRTPDRYERAIRLYERAGFRPVGARRHRRDGLPGVADEVDLVGEPLLAAS